MKKQNLLSATLAMLALLVTGSARGEAQVGVLTCKSIPGSRTNRGVGAAAGIGFLYFEADK